MSLSRAFITFVLLCGTAFGQDQAAQQFQQLYGQKIEAVRRSSNRLDDVKLAEQLIEDAGVLGAQSDLGRLLYQEAVQLAGDSSVGVNIAIRALSLSLGKQADQYPKYLERLLELQEKRYRMAPTRDKPEAQWRVIATMSKLAELKVNQGDLGEAAGVYRRLFAMLKRRSPATAEVVKQMLDELGPWERMQGRIDRLKARVQNNPNDRTAGKELITIYLLELDQPGEAHKYSFLVGDEEMKVRLRDAAKPIEKLSTDACLALGNWYLELADDARGEPKRTALQRAVGAYQHFLKIYETADVKRSAALLRLKDLQDQLKRVESELSQQR